MQRYGITVPFDGIPLAAQRELFAELPDLGYTDVWSSEVDGADAFTPLVLASVWAPALRLGTAIAPVFTRGPATLAQCAASLAAAAPGRVAIGIGASSDLIVERWNGTAFDRPLERVRDTARFLRAALAGARVTERYETFAVDGFRLGLVPDPPPRLLVAALRPGMLRLAGEIARCLTDLVTLPAPTLCLLLGEGAGGGHAPDIIRIAGEPHVHDVSWFDHNPLVLHVSLRDLVAQG